MSLKTLMSSLLDCFVPKNGGVVGTVYGKRTSELGIADISSTYVTVSTNINGFRMSHRVTDVYTSHLRTQTI